MRKILKTLPLVAVALFVMLAFSGCDKILEVFYPDETGQGEGSGENTVIVNINVPTSIQDWSAYKVIVQIYRTDDTSWGHQQRDGYAYWTSDDTPATMKNQFDFLPDGSYSLFAWLDTTGDGQYTDGEEAVGGVDTFYMPWWNAEQQQSNSTAQFTFDLMEPAGADNSVNLTVRVEKASNVDHQYPVIVMLESQDGLWFQDPARELPYDDSKQSDSYKWVYEVAYANLPAGWYKMWAWVDKENDWYWNEATEAGVRIPTEHGQTFPVPYYSLTNPSSFYVPNLECDIYAPESNPTFTLNGPASVDKNSYGVSTMWVSPQSSDKTFSNVSFKVFKADWSGVYYMGYWTPDSWLGASDTDYSDGNTFSFSVDFTYVDPPLDSTGWDGYDSLIIQVFGSYEDGSSYQTEWYVSLTDYGGGGTYYDLYFYPTFTSYPYGRVEATLYDTSTWNALVSQTVYFDASGNGYNWAYFTGIYDPEDTDQYLYVAVYDQYGSVMSYYEKWLQDEFEGSYYYYLTDGTWDP